jgi:rubrerythrin
MILRYNADEILEMAEQIERNGSKFYQRAAEQASDEGARKMMRELAAMEDDHERTFAAMRSELSFKEKEPVVFDPDNEQFLYLRAMADRNVFDTSADPSARLTGKEKLEDILQMAIGMEKDSIIFYMGLRELVSERLGKGRLDNIIQEEYSHIATLAAKMPG